MTSTEIWQRVGDHEKILYEMNQAIQEAIAEHRRAGNPIAIWRDGQVVWIEAHEDLPPSTVP